MNDEILEKTLDNTKQEVKQGQILKKIVSLVAVIFLVVAFLFIIENTNSGSIDTTFFGSKDGSALKLLVNVHYSEDQQDKNGVYAIDPITDEITQFSKYPYRFWGQFGKNFLFTIENTNNYFLYDYISKGYKPLNFPLLRNEGNTYEQLFVNQQTTIDGGDKILLSVLTYDNRDAISEYSGGRPVKEMKKYIYSFSKNQFEEAKDIESLKKLLEKEENESVGYSLLSLDERTQSAIFQFSGEGVGSGEIVAINTTDRTVRKVDDVFNDNTHIGRFYVDRKTNMGFYLESKERTVLAKIVSLDDVLKPIYALDLTSEMQKIEDVIIPDLYSVAWLNDGSRMLLGFSDKISMFDFKKNRIETLYQDDTLGVAYMFWGRDSIETDGEKTFAFIDYYSAKYTPCKNSIGCPSYLPADNRSRVIIQNISDKTQNIFFDDASSKDIIGWLEI